MQFYRLHIIKTLIIDRITSIEAHITKEQDGFAMGSLAVLQLWADRLAVCVDYSEDIEDSRLPKLSALGKIVVNESSAMWPTYY